MGAMIDWLIGLWLWYRFRRSPRRWIFEEE